MKKTPIFSARVKRSGRRSRPCPGRVFSGKVALVYPQLDAATRTNRVRFSVSNSGGALRPGMYATAEVNVPLRNIEPFKTLAAEASPLRQDARGG